MPIYEYKCSNGHKFEQIRKYEDRDDPVLCCDPPAERIPSIFNGRVFKGVITDNLGDEPVRIGSTRRMNDEARARGLVPITEKIDTEKIRKAKKEHVESQIKKSVENHWRPEAERVFDQMTRR